MALEVFLLGIVDRECLTDFFGEPDLAGGIHGDREGRADGLGKNELLDGAGDRDPTTVTAQAMSALSQRRAGTHRPGDRNGRQHQNWKKRGKALDQAVAILAKQRTSHLIPSCVARVLPRHGGLIIVSQLPVGILV